MMMIIIIMDAVVIYDVFSDNIFRFMANKYLMYYIYQVDYLFGKQT